MTRIYNYQTVCLRIFLSTAFRDRSSDPSSNISFQTSRPYPLPKYVLVYDSKLLPIHLNRSQTTRMLLDQASQIIDELGNIRRICVTYIRIPDTQTKNVLPRRRPQSPLPPLVPLFIRVPTICPLKKKPDATKR